MWKKVTFWEKLRVTSIFMFKPGRLSVCPWMLFLHSFATAVLRPARKQTSGVNLKLEIWHMQALKLDNWPPISNKNIALNRNLSPHGIWPKDTTCNSKFNDRRPTRRQWCENHRGMTPCKVILLPQQLRSGEAWKSCGINTKTHHKPNKAKQRQFET